MAKCPRIAVTGVYDLRAEQARQLASQFPSARLYDWAEEIVDDPAIDAVAILTPPSAHASLVETALHAQKHVLVESPLALSSADAWRLAGMARDSGLVCATGFYLRQHRLVQRARQAIASRRIGRVGAVHSVWSSPALQRVPLNSWRAMDHLGGNLLHELGLHHLDLWRFLLGEELHALHAETLDVGEASARVQLVTRTYSGVLIHTTLLAGAADVQEVEILGERGALRFSLRHPASFRELRVAAGSAAAGANKGNWSSAVAEWPEAVAVALRGGDLAACYRAQWESFAEAVMLQGRAAAGFDDAYVSLELVERAYGASLRQIDLQPSAQQGVAEAGPASVAQDQFAKGSRHASSALSVVLASANTFDALKPLLAHLRAQTVAADLELVIVGPSRPDMEPDPLWMEGFHSWQFVRAPALPSLAPAFAAGVRHARSELVAPCHAHAFPEARWAELLVAAHRGGHTVVSPVFRNANPTTNVSWADFLIHAGEAMLGRRGGPVDELTGEGFGYRKSVLLDFGEDLDTLLADEEALCRLLARQGHPLYRESQAVLARANYSNFDSWISASFFAGRVSAGRRTEAWNALQRLVYCLLALLLPYRRLLRTVTAASQAGFSAGAIAKAAPYLWLGFTVHSLGEFLGYATGTGRALEALSHYAHFRWRHVTADEKEALFERFQRM
jgi:predicted dehydrogenase